MAEIKHWLSILFPSGVQFMLSITVIMVAAIFVLALVETRKRHMPLRRGWWWRAAVFLLEAAVVIVVLNQLSDYAKWRLENLQAREGNGIGLAFGALMIGVVAFYARLKVQFWYGIVEVFASIIFAVSTMEKEPPATPHLLSVYSALFASAYVVVRGITNMAEGTLGKEHVNNWPAFKSAAFEKLKKYA